MAHGVWKTKILVIFIMMYVSCEATECGARMNSIGYTIPSGDITLEVGSSLDITCVMENKTLLGSVRNPSKRMFFRYEMQNLSKMFEIVDERSIRLHIPYMHITTGPGWYYCFYKYENGTDAHICHNAVFVGTQPKNVTDFGCISNNLDNLTCSWTPPDNNILTHYDLTFTLPGRAGRYNPSGCPEIETKEANGVTKMSCFWSIATTPHYRQAQSTYNFQLTMNNSLGYNNLSYAFDHFKYVRTGPPENLKGMNATANSILLYFKIPNTMITFNPGLECRILYQCIHGPTDWTRSDISIIKSQSEVYFNLTGLEHAHDVCDIRVSLRSTKSKDENMWSSNSSITHWTANTIPGAPPKVNIGSFQIDKQYNRSFFNDVYIYWQQIPEAIMNGPEFKYFVEVIGNRDNVKLAEMTMSYAKFENLQSNKDYTFVIWSQNEMGNSSEKSFITVPAQSKRPKYIESFTKMARQNGTYELFITPPTDSYNIKNFTIFWCHNNKDRPYQCTGYLNWAEIPKNSTHFHVPVLDSTNAIWQFAMSVNSEHYSSGMVWASCTLLDNQRIGKIKQVFKIGNGRSGSIQLGWKLDCFDSTPNIEGFIIYYCPIASPKTQNCKGSVRNVTILGDASTTNGNVTGLKPYTTYKLNVSIKKNTGDIGEESDPVYETTLEGAPSAPVNVKIARNSITNASVTLIWQPPDEMNGALKYYELHYNNETKTVNPTPNPEHTLNRLSSFQRYEVYIQACTTSCSQPSPKITFTTEIGTPEQIRQPRIHFQNNSFIVIDWQKPYPPRGPIDYYEVKIREKRVQDSRSTINNNVTAESFVINCGEGGELNTLYFSVRAINKARQNYLYGPWSEELECYCTNPPNIFVWVLIVVGFLLMILFAYVMKRAFMCCKVMKNVELKLPPGLAPLPDWGSPKGQEEPENSPSADEELLLEKMNENRIPSGDSSGCCSGHGSVASDSGTTMSNTSDSGTEQNELRKRAKNTNSGPMRLNVNTQYVTMPSDAANKSRIKPSPGNYCVLGVDPSAQVEPENKYISPVPQPTPKLPYISCDAPTSSYVTTGDINKPTNSGYVPINYGEPTEKNPSYVMAGTRNTLMPESSKNQEENKPIYLQVSDATKTVSDINPWQPQVDNNVPKGYVTVGESLPNKRVAESKKGYVPHSRHFDTKLLKED